MVTAFSLKLASALVARPDGARCGAAWRAVMMRSEDSEHSESSGAAVARCGGRWW
ncbi:MAG: hypothetical protein ACI30W_04935 [Muribaculaceae bacterium]